MHAKKLNENKPTDIHLFSFLQKQRKIANTGSTTLKVEKEKGMKLHMKMAL